MLRIEPQPGPQVRFLTTPADVAIYGGSAGGGKTYALLMEAARHVSNPKFRAVIFRRESTQITNEGGLWDTATEIFPGAGGTPYQNPALSYRWRSGARIRFAHLNRELDVLGWQGSQIPLICFDELTHFERSQFFYMLSRNRSMCGVRPYVRATCNPDADSWVADMVAWYIDQETGYPIPERSGVVRYFARVNDALRWGDSRQALAEAEGIPPEDCKSFTFVPASVEDNRILLATDPGYLANLKALSLVERERLLGGNWKIRPAAGLYFRKSDVRIVAKAPADVIAWVRGWDLAATAPGEDTPDPDWTFGVKIGLRVVGGLLRFVVADARHVRARAAEVRDLVKATAAADGRRVTVSLPEDPGQAGKDQTQSYRSLLAGYDVRFRRRQTNKIIEAEPFAAQWQGGAVEVVSGPWNTLFFSQLEAFPDKSSHDDAVDAAVDGFATVLHLRPISPAASVPVL